MKYFNGFSKPSRLYHRTNIADGKYAKSKEISLNKLFDELATIALTQYDTKTRFELTASKGDKAKGLELLDKLDKSHSAIEARGRVDFIFIHPLRLPLFQSRFLRII